MAKFSDEIIIKQELRPCIVTYEKSEVKGLFHKWIEITDLIRYKITVGLVELEDGRMDEVPTSKIKFIDNKIKEFCFEEETKIDDIYIPDNDDLPF